jgi:predicted sulfurtransferase
MADPAPAPAPAPAPDPDPDHHEGAEEWGVLLYYKFVALARPARDALFLHDLCASLALRGRLRVAPDGINVTVTGPLSALRAHAAALRAHPRFACPPIDFKLSPAPPVARVPPHLALATGFSSLSVRVVPHLITLAPDPPLISAAGPLVSPLQFHSLLQHPSPSRPCVLIDARNLYETRIGKFHPPPHVQFLDPLLRQYSDLPGACPLPPQCLPHFRQVAIPVAVGASTLSW